MMDKDTGWQELGPAATVPSGPFSDDLRSIRSSCDRCRSHKLKCVVLKVPDGNQCCQRCARAMVPCIFSRRNASSRTAARLAVATNTAETATTDSEWPHKRPKFGSTTAPTAASESEDFPSPRPRSPTSSLNFPDAAYIENATAVGSTAETVNASPLCSSEHGVSAQCTLSGLENTGSRGIDNNFWDCFAEQTIVWDPQSIMDDLPSSPRNTSAFSRNQQDSNATNFADISVPSSFLSSEHNPPPGNFAQPGLYLSESRALAQAVLKFATDVNKRLESLQNEPWQGRGFCFSLDDYPIGSVLHLSQKLGSLAVAHKNLERDGEKQKSNGKAIASPPFDIPVSLVLLCCYVTFLQVCTAVLRDFQSYLSSIQPSGGPRASLTTSSPTAVLCLGELLPANEPHLRVHAALRMLLDSIAEAEEALSLPSQVRLSNVVRLSETLESSTTPEAWNASSDPLNVGDAATSLIRWGLLRSAPGIQDALLSLGQEVRNIKEVLRHRMDL